MTSAPGRVLLLALVVGATACATRQTYKAQPAGFLGDYSQLAPGGKGELQLRYINPNVDWKKYDAVKIDPVTIWIDRETTLLSGKDRYLLTSYLHAALVEALRKDYELVEAPGPGAMRLRAAITEAQGAKLLMNGVMGVVPQLRVVTTIGGMATDTSVFVGKASIEMEMVDSVSGERLGAGVDQRAGTKDPANMLNKWDDVRNAFKQWAEKVDRRLDSLRGE